MTRRRRGARIGGMTQNVRSLVLVLAAAGCGAASQSAAPAPAPTAAAPTAPVAPAPPPAAGPSAGAAATPAAGARPAPGDVAPDLDLRDQDGAPWRLASLRGSTWAVVAFYPKASTPG